MILIPYYEKECWVINNCISFVTHALDYLKIPHELCHGNDLLKHYNRSHNLILTIHPTGQIIPTLGQYEQIPAKKIWWDFESPYEIDTLRYGMYAFDYIYLFCENSRKAIGNDKVRKLPTATDTTVYKPTQVTSDYITQNLFIGNAFPSRIQYFSDKEGYTIIGVGYPDEIKKKHTVIDRIISPTEANKWYNGAKEILEMDRTVDDVDLGQNRDKIKPDYIPMRHWDIMASRGLNVEGHTFIELVEDYILPLA